VKLWPSRKPVEPTPPEDVRVVMADGRHIPIECVYLGLHDGVHEWAAVYVLGERPVSLQIARLPGRTAVGIAYGKDAR